ncbi:MAG TPA: hypothetical protein VJ947_02395 [Pseudohaliea sp.]|nr:hypothetical protein [Pseudohaliea sp.]HZX22631.1 hypothetical protein [Woeseiaceae bacterium]
MLLNQLTDELLDAFDGICYTVEPDGRIAAIGPGNWDRFARTTGLNSPRAHDVRDRNLFEFIGGDEVGGHYRTIMQELRRPEFSEWVMHFRCDGPDRKRGIRLVVRPLREDETVTGYLFQSVVLEETLRPNLGILDFETLRRGLEHHRSRPLVTVCSYCQRVKDDSHTNEEWVTAERYYALGGDSRVRLSHGVCPPCYKDLSESFVRH